MSADQPLHSFDAGDTRRGDPLFTGDAADLAEAQRLDEALEELASGREPDVDPREDPALAGLVQTAAVLQHLFADATDGPAFDSYRARSRAAILHRMERAPVSLAAERRRRLRTRVVSVFAPMAAAAAAAAITFTAFAGGGLSGTPQLATGPTVENQTPRSLDAQLARLQTTLAEIASNTQRGVPVQTDLLRRVTEDNASVQQQIAAQPERVDPGTVAQYARAANQSRQVLQTAKPEAGAEGALSAAQVTADQGVVTAARYLESHGDAGTPVATETATATPEATETATPTSEVTATETPTADTTETPTSTVTATVQATGTAIPATTDALTPAASPSGTPNGRGTAASSSTAPATVVPSATRAVGTVPPDAVAP